MKLLTDKLYERIFINEYKQSTQLRVISGYASPEFLERVLREFCGKISLYIGMSEHDGIAIKNHQRFVELCNRFGSRLKVYYQIEGPPSHMKLIEFTSLTTKSTYIGSANFSENGFFKQREVMTKVDSFNDSIFTYQELISRLCLDPDIDTFIPFYEDISDIEERMDIAPSTIVVEEKYQRLEKEKMIAKRFMQLRSRANIDYWKKFSISVISNDNPRWNMEGINSIFSDRVPTLVQTTGVFFDKLFPVGSNFVIYSDDGNVYHARLTGSFNKQLKLIDGDLYKYVRDKLELSEYRPISREELEKKGLAKIHFERIDEMEYIMFFSNVD